MTVVTEQLFCEGCGDPIAAIAGNGRGNCCFELPRRYSRGPDGLFNQVQTGEAPPRRHHVEDDEDDERPYVMECPGCESREWVVSASQSIRSDEEDGGDTLWYDSGDFQYEVHCSNCGRQNRDADLEHM